MATWNECAGETPHHFQFLACGAQRPLSLLRPLRRRVLHRRLRLTPPPPRRCLTQGLFVKFACCYVFYNAYGRFGVFRNGYKVFVSGACCYLRRRFGVGVWGCLDARRWGVGALRGVSEQFEALRVLCSLPFGLLEVAAGPVEWFRSRGSGRFGSRRGVSGSSGRAWALRGASWCSAAR